ncbi:MAG: hypothetical protein QE278_00080 [Limnobacter sp.]|nr:hypothetical protein [Limnobacter sp.]
MPHFTITPDIRDLKDTVRGVPLDIRSYIDHQKEPFKRVVENLGQTHQQLKAVQSPFPLDRNLRALEISATLLKRHRETVLEHLTRFDDLCIAQDRTVTAYKTLRLPPQIESALRHEILDRHQAQRAAMHNLKQACIEFDKEMELSKLHLKSRRQVLDLVTFALKPLPPPNTRAPKDPYLHPAGTPAHQAAPSNASI